MPMKGEQREEEAEPDSKVGDTLDEESGLYGKMMLMVLLLYLLPPLIAATQNTYSGEAVTKVAWSVTTPHSDPYTDDRDPPPTAKQLADAAATGKPYSPDGDDLVKVVILGAPGVGKTSIIQVRE